MLPSRSTQDRLGLNETAAWSPAMGIPSPSVHFSKCNEPHSEPQWPRRVIFGSSFAAVVRCRRTAKASIRALSHTRPTPREPVSRFPHSSFPSSPSSDLRPHHDASRAVAWYRRGPRRLARQRPAFDPHAPAERTDPLEHRHRRDDDGFAPNRRGREVYFAESTIGTSQNVSAAMPLAPIRSLS